MGYYTRHKLSVLDGEHGLIAEFVAENEEAAYAIDKNGDTEESCKWYRHQEDMKSFLKQLKAKLGTGGAIKESSFEIQGEHCDKIILVLEKMGYRPKRSGK